jgi:hypothetical protein
MFEKSNNTYQPDWKFFGLPHSFFKMLVTISFAVLSLSVFCWMYRSYYYTNPFVPHDSNLQGTALYGRDMEGALGGSIEFFCIEMIPALAVLIPYSFSRWYFIRTLILGLLYGGWLLLLLIVAMHSGSLFMINIVGVFGIEVLLGIWFILTLIADQKNKTNPANLWNKR